MLHNIQKEVILWPIYDNLFQRHRSLIHYVDNLLNFNIFTTMDLMKLVEKEITAETSFPEFKAGDTITVNYKIKEGNKERIQQFRGVVIQRRGKGVTATFTVRKMSGNIGVERIFPVNSPFIDSIEVNKVGAVRRARIFYFRDLTGKKAKIKEKKNVVAKED